MKIGKVNLSYITLWFAILLILSASFMTQVWTIASRIFGVKPLEFACVIGISLTGLGMLLYISRQKLKFFKLILSLIILCLSFWYAWRQPYFVKRIHTLEYYILGLLAMRDLIKFPDISISKKISYALLLVFIVACLDEGFQALLPYRSGDIPDIITDLIGGFAGIILYLLAKGQNYCPKRIDVI